MAHLFDRLMLQIELRSRVLSTGERVLPKAALETIPTLIPVSRKVTPQHFEQLATFERRIG